MGSQGAPPEYGGDSVYIRRMPEAGAVDVLQADATRCAGVTGFLQAGPLCQAFHPPLSAHTAPTLHGRLGCAALCARDVEYFHDHARIEGMCFDGVPGGATGMLRPADAPGMARPLQPADIEKFRVL